MKLQKLLSFAIAVSVASALACSQASAPPTAPNAGDLGTGAAGPDGSTLKATAPVAVSPVGGLEISDLDPDLVIQNAQGRFVQGLSLSYVFQVFDDENRLVYQSNPVPEGSGGQTTHEIANDLEADVVHTWRAYPVYQGQRGPMSSSTSFKTLNRFGVSCAHHGAPIPIIACRFEQHDGANGMDHEELIQFMKEVAYDLNQAIGSDKGGYGLLRKDVGNNCLGYSCDIICEGNGNDQNQFDILIDERIPNWGEVGEGIVVRECEIIK